MLNNSNNTKGADGSPVCLISPRYFKTKESVKLSADATLRFFEENPKADYAEFLEWLRSFSKLCNDSPNYFQIAVMEEIMEYARLVPPVFADLRRKFAANKRLGIGIEASSKSLRVPRFLLEKISKFSRVSLKGLYDDFSAQYLNVETPTLEELVDALILYRIDYNAETVYKIVEEIAREEADAPTWRVRDRVKDKLCKRAKGASKYVLNWNGEGDVVELYDFVAGNARLFRIKNADGDWSGDLSESLKNALERERKGFDYLAEMEDKAAEKELQELGIESEKDDESDDSEYDKLLESQVATPPAWYIEEVWGRLRLPGIHLPPEMMSRYLSLYEQKRNGTRRTSPRLSQFASNKVVDSRKQ